jgi:FLVCR family MFS transporter 7
MPIRKSLRALANNGSFYLLFIPFAIYVGFFNASSALINQFLEPYGFTENEAGIGGALLIFVGILSAALISPLTDRTHAYVIIIKTLIPLVAAAYLGFVFCPPTRNIVAADVVLAILGACSFAILPVTLEYVVEVTFPVGPEVTSTILWTAGQLLGGIFTIVMSALKDEDGTPEESHSYPPGNMQRALVFQAIICCLTAVFPMGLGMKILGLGGDARRRIRAGEINRPGLREV